MSRPSVKQVSCPFLVLGEEDAAATDAEGVVRGFGRDEESANTERGTSNRWTGEAELLFLVVKGLVDIAFTVE